MPDLIGHLFLSVMPDLIGHLFLSVMPGPDRASPVKADLNGHDGR